MTRWFLIRQDTFRIYMGSVLADAASLDGELGRSLLHSPLTYAREEVKHSDWVARHEKQ